jgi:hypothetical protein
MRKKYLLYETSIFVSIKYHQNIIYIHIMEIFSHFCDVFIQYYNIMILHFYYHTFSIALSGILYQKMPKKL